MIRGYLNQTAVWQSAQSINQYNEISYALTQTIPCRKEGINKLINNSLGQAVVTNTLVFCNKDVRVNDRIDGRLVLRVDNVIAYGGNINHLEVYLQ